MKLEFLAMTAVVGAVCFLMLPDGKKKEVDYKDLPAKISNPVLECWQYGIKEIVVDYDVYKKEQKIFNEHTGLLYEIKYCEEF